MRQVKSDWRLVLNAAVAQAVTLQGSTHELPLLQIAQPWGSCPMSCGYIVDKVFHERGTTGLVPTVASRNGGTSANREKQGIYENNDPFGNELLSMCASIPGCTVSSDA
jgi:hypothetical protein